jgi:hypothetical protein
LFKLSLIITKKEHFMKTLAFSAETPQELETNLQKALADGLHPSLACVFCSVTQPIEQIRAIFAGHQVAVFGCTTSGEIVNSSAMEESIAVMLLEFPSGSFAMQIFDGVDKSSHQVGEMVAQWAHGAFASPSLLVLSAGLQADGEAIVRGIIDTIGYEVPLFGGLAGDNLMMQGTYVFTTEKMIGLGVLALALDDEKIEVKGLTVSGWKGFGTTKTITHSAGNIVYTIDDQPALDIYSRYLNIGVGDDHTLAAEYPLLLVREDGTLVMRAAMLVNPDKSMIYAGSVPQGAQVQFSMSPNTEIIDIALENLKRFKEGVNQADAVIIFSCKARHLTLGPMIEDEISAIHDLWGTPLVGFFSYGEIGPTTLGHCDFHNDTLSFVSLRAK